MLESEEGATIQISIAKLVKLLLTCARDRLLQERWSGFCEEGLGDNEFLRDNILGSMVCVMAFMKGLAQVRKVG